jgi:hypothetical protein
MIKLKSWDGALTSPRGAAGGGGGGGGAGGGGVCLFSRTEEMSKILFSFIPQQDALACSCLQN